MIKVIDVMLAEREEASSGRAAYGTETLAGVNLVFAEAGPQAYQFDDSRGLSIRGGLY